MATYQVNLVSSEGIYLWDTVDEITGDPIYPLQVIDQDTGLTPYNQGDVLQVIDADGNTDFDTPSLLTGYLVPFPDDVFHIRDSVTSTNKIKFLCDNVTSDHTLKFADRNQDLNLIAKTCFVVACSDEETALVADPGVAVLTFRMPFAMTLTDVRASLTGAGSTSGTTTIDINEGGTTIFSTELTIDYGEKTSTTAATPAVISDTSLADDAEMTVNIEAVTGGADETGLKVYLIGYVTS